MWILFSLRRRCREEIWSQVININHISTFKLVFLQDGQQDSHTHINYVPKKFKLIQKLNVTEREIVTRCGSLSVVDNVKQKLAHLRVIISLFHHTLDVSGNDPRTVQKDLYKG